MEISSRILKMNVNITSLFDVTNLIINKFMLISHSSKYVCVSNVHMCMASFDSDSYQKVINNADIVVPDGKPLVWAQKLLGHNMAKQVRGIDLTMALCDMASKKGVHIGFYGSTNHILQKIIYNLNSDFKNLNVTYSFSPPFRKLSNLEDRKIVEEIRLLTPKEMTELFIGAHIIYEKLFWLKKSIIVVNNAAE